MAVLTSTLVFSLWIVCSASSVNQTIKAELGKDVVLNCRGSSSNINLVVWTRADLGKHQYVFYRNGKNNTNQLLSYRGRVSLQDPKMKNGNVAVVLKNVNNNDTGTYECLVRETKTGRRKRAAGPYKPQSRNKIQLIVRSQDPVSGEHPQSGSGGLTDGSSPEAAGLHGHIGLPVAAVVMVVVMFIVSGVVWKRSTKKRAEQPAADGEHEEDKLSVP